jgi:glycerol-3-phosphate acyltransferase PlsY
MGEFFGNINVIFYIAAYLIGAIPFGLIIAKTFANVDITLSGSKSIGATNVLRVVKEKNPVLAKKLGAATLILDALKASLVLVVAILLNAPSDVLWTMGVLAVVGHCYSPYLMFEGGKGVATGFGVLVVLAPIQAVVGIVVWGISAKLLKVSSISSLVGLGGALVAAYFAPQPFSVGVNTPIILIAFLIFYKHLPNLIRLFNKQETAVV